MVRKQYKNLICISCCFFSSHTSCNQMNIILLRWQRILSPFFFVLFSLRIRHREHIDTRLLSTCIQGRHLRSPVAECWRYRGVTVNSASWVLRRLRELWRTLPILWWGSSLAHRVARTDRPGSVVTATPCVRRFGYAT